MKTSQTVEHEWAMSLILTTVNLLYLCFTRMTPFLEKGFYFLLYFPLLSLICDIKKPSAQNFSFLVRWFWADSVIFQHPFQYLFICDQTSRSEFGPCTVYIAHCIALLSHNWYTKIQIYALFLPLTTALMCSPFRWVKL